MAILGGERDGTVAAAAAIAEKNGREKGSIKGFCGVSNVPILPLLFRIFTGRALIELRSY